MDKVNICGIPHTIESTVDILGNDSNLGQIQYAECRILLNSKLTPELKNNTLIHEVVHGILTHLGYNDLSNDEVFVCGLTSAIAQTFEFKENIHG